MPPLLFTPYKIRDLELKNRIVMSPMCQYSAIDGVPNEWHQVHLGTRAVGGVGLIIVEATGVSPDGRISKGCTGLWNDIQKDAFLKITAFVKSQGARIGIQLAHAGRKSSLQVSWKGGTTLSAEEGAWQTVAPTALPFSKSYPTPHSLSIPEIAKIVDQFKSAAKRADEAGFELIELHFAHGYLAHEFLSPLSNFRTDQYGGSFDNRIRFAIEVTKAVREAWGVSRPLFARISATDWVEGGWSIDDSIELSKALKAEGVDLVDCSSGGNAAEAVIKTGPGYQVPFARDIKAKAAIPTAAVGLITDALQAEAILAEGSADLIFIGRELLRDPYFALEAAQELGVDLPWPVQYDRAKKTSRSNK